MDFKKIDRFIRDLNHKRIDLFRYIRMKLVKLLFDQQWEIIKDSDQAPYNNILILRLDDKLGDGVASTGFLRSVKKSNLESQLTVVTGPRTAEVYRSSAYVDKVVVIEKSWLSFLNSVVSLRKDKYDYVVNTSHILTPRVVMIMSLMKSCFKLGFLNSDYKLFTATASYDEKKDHVTVRYKKLLELMKAAVIDLSYELTVDVESKKKVDKLIEKYAVQNRKIILINSFAGGRLRNFSQQITTEIVTELLKSPDYLVVSVANLGDHSIVEKWREQAKHLNRWLQFKSLHSLADNIALLERAHLVITPDTSWVHLASALGKNLIAVYRNDGVEKNSQIWAPLHKNSKVIYSPSLPEKPEDINNFSVRELVNEAILRLQMSSN